MDGWIYQKRGNRAHKRYCCLPYKVTFCRPLMYMFLPKRWDPVIRVSMRSRNPNWALSSTVISSQHLQHFVSLRLLLNVMVTTLPNRVQAPSVTGSFLTFIIKLHTWARAFETPASIEPSWKASSFLFSVLLKRICIQGFRLCPVMFNRLSCSRQLALLICINDWW